MEKLEILLQLPRFVLYSYGVGKFANPGSFPLEAPGNRNS